MRTGTSLSGRRSAAAVLVLWLVVLLVGLLAVRAGPPWLTDPDQLRGFFLGFGVLAPVAFVVVQAAQVVVAPLPGQLLGFVAGYLFGAAAGLGLSLAGATLGTYIAVRLSRRYGRPAVERLVPSTTIDRFDAAVARRGLLALFLIFLIPGLPDDAICFVAGLTRLRVRGILAVSILGRIPGYLLVVVAGARLAGGHETDALLLLALLATVSIGVYLGREPLLRWLTGEPA